MVTNDTSTIPPDAGESTGASRTLIFSAVVVAAIVVLGLVLSLTNVFGGGTEPSTPTAAPSAPSTETAGATSTSEASVCGLDTVEMNGTLNIAPTATWSLVGTTAAPSVEDHGPGVVEDGGFRNCYSRTPTGAVLAAANLIAMGSQAALLGPRMSEDSTVPGPGRDAALARAPATPDTSGVRIQIAGFRLLAYDGNTAEVDIALRTSTGAIAAQVFILNWVDGDWKVVLAPSGDLPSPMSQLPSLSGYIAWSGA